MGFVFILVFAGAHANERPFAFEFLAAEDEMEFPVAERGRRVIPGNFVSAHVPKHDCARAVVAVRNGPFETAVLNRMIFNLHGETPVARSSGETFGDRP